MQALDRTGGTHASPLARQQSREGEEPLAGFLQTVGDGGTRRRRREERKTGAGEMKARLRRVTGSLTLSPAGPRVDSVVHTSAWQTTTKRKRRGVKLGLDDTLPGG
jgi:hypothetical protein